MRYIAKKILLISFAGMLISGAVGCKKESAENNGQAKATPATMSWQADVDESTRQFRNIYKKARTLQQEKDYENAYNLYKMLDSNYGILYDFVLFNRAEVAKNIPDEASVISDLKTLITKYPDSPLVDLATYSLGQSYVRIKDDENAAKYFKETIKKYPQTDYAVASSYYLAEILAKEPGKKNEAVEKFTYYLKETPEGKFAVNCASAILKLKGNESLSKQEQELIGLAYYHGGQYGEAIKYLKDHFNERTWYALGKSYQLQGKKDDSIQLFSRAINSFNGLDPEEIDNAVKATALMKGNSFDAWNYCQKTFPSQADIAIYFKAQKLYDNQALGLYQKIVAEFPQSRYAPEANWVIFWSAFNSGNYDKAIEQGKLHSKNYPDSKSLSRIVFWVGKAYERKGQKDMAINVYEKLASKIFGDYYSYRAQGRLNELKYNKPDNQWKTYPVDYNYDVSWSPPLPVSYEYIETLYGNKVTELIYLGDIESAKKIIGNNVDPRLEGYFTLKDGLISRSIVIVRDSQQEHILKPPGREKSWELLYPLHFSDLIKQHAAKNSIDPLLAQALTREESYFNHQAVSSSNARGLMQLIPSTANAVARWEKLSSFSQLDLFKPEINVRLGSRYLKYTHDTFSGNSMLAVAAYNGGPGNVNKWLRTIPSNDWDQFVENIPLSETRNYVRKVFRSYWAYREIYTGTPVLISNK